MKQFLLRNALFRKPGRIPLAAIILIILPHFLQGQYLEYFTGQGGKGVVNATCTGASSSTCTPAPNLTGVNWTITGDFSGFSNGDDFGVFSFGGFAFFQAEDTDNEVCWVSPTLDISAPGAVSISVFASEQDNLEPDDYIRAEYSLNGGPFVQFGYQADDFPSGTRTFTVSGLTGNTLVIRICVDVNGEAIRFDNILVPQSGVTLYTGGGPCDGIGDADNDGTCDDVDGCPNDPNKIAPGDCGCGTPDTDSDNDGTPNCLDGCPNDPNKIDPGVCGCGVPDIQTPLFIGLADVCEGSGLQTGLSGGVPMGGVYSGPGVIDGGNGLTFSFNPAIAGPGTHTIVYTLSSGVCEEEACSQLTVHPTPGAPPAQVIDACLAGSTEITPASSGVGCTNQKVLFVESFETDGEQTRYDATLETIGTPDAYFNRVTDADLNIDYNGEVGSYYWAGEDHDNLLVGNGDPSLQIDFSAGGPTTNIVGETGVVFKGLFAANPNSPFSPNGSGANVGEPDSYLRVDYQIDAGFWIPALQFARSASGTGLALDTDFDGVGDCDVLSRDFKEFSFPIPNPGPLFKLRIFMHVDEAGEEYAIDNFGIYADGPADCLFNFYDANPDLGPANLLAGPASSYDPGNTTTQSYWVTQVNSYGCEGPATEFIVQISQPIVTFTAPDLDVCIEDGVITGLGGGSPTGGVYSGPGVIDGNNGTTFSFNPAAAGSGTKTITYSLSGGCSSEATDDIFVNTVCCDGPEAICATGPVDLFLDNSGNATLLAAQVDNGSTADCGLQSLTVSPNTFDCNSTGIHSVTLTITDSKGDNDNCITTINVADNTPPSIACPGLLILGNQLNQCGIGIDVPTPITSDNCEVVETVARYRLVDQLGIPLGPFSGYSNDPSGFYDVGRYEMQWTAVDAANNQESCSFYIEIRDLQFPTALCKNITVQLGSDHTASITGSDIDNGSSDNCGIGSLTPDITGFDCDDLETPVAVTLSVTDVNGNTATCQSTVTVAEDDHPCCDAPQAICQDVTVQLDENGNASITANDVNNGSTAECGLQSLALDFSSFNCISASGPAPETVTLTVTDISNRTSTCTAAVTVRDDLDPDAVCQDVTVQLNTGGTGTLAAAAVDNGSSDNCGVSLSLDQTSFDCDDISTGTITELFISEYIEGSSSNKCIEIYNGTGASVNLSGYQLLFYFNGSSSAGTTINLSGTVADGDVWVVCDNDASSSFVGQSDQISFSTFYNGDDAVVLAKNGTAIDIIGRIGEDPGSDWSVSGNSTQDHTLVRNPDVMSGNTANAAGFPSLGTEWTEYANNTSSHLGSHTVNGPATVTLTATDPSGNTSTCSAVVTVEDNAAPNAICRNVTVQLNSNGNGSTTAAAVNNGSNDGCGIASVSLNQTSFDCDDLGANTVTLTVTDNHDNTATCTAIVTVTDNTDPDAVCQDIVVELNENGTAAITGEDIDNGSSDNCGVSSLSLDITGFDCEDVTPAPEIADLFISEYIEGSNNNKCIEVYNGTGASVNLSGYQLLFYFGGSNTAGTTITLSGTVADGDVWVVCDNDANSSFLNQADQTSNSGFFNGDDAVVLTKNGTPIDIIGRIGEDPGTQWNVSGNSTQDHTLVRNPNVLSGNTANAAGFPSLGTEWTEFPNNTSSNLGSHSINSGGTTVTLTVADGSENSSTCTATVTIKDKLAPTALCQNLTVQLGAEHTASVTAEEIDNGSSDNCGIASISLNQTGFDCDDVAEPVSVTLTVTDNYGNTSTCTASVTVSDSQNPCCEGPQAVCQNITVQLDGSGNATITGDDIDNGSTSECGLESLEVDIADFDCNDVGSPVTVTLTVSDVNENTATCTATVTVEDNVAPTANCQNTTVQLGANGEGTASAGNVDNNSFDACGIQSLALSQTGFNCSNVGSNTVTLTVTDVNGNASTCSATVTVEDNVAPTALCQNITVQLDENGEGSAAAEAVNNGSSDACGVQSAVLSPQSFTCANVGSNMVTLTVTDVNGNASTCSANVTVEDNVAPTALCRNVTVQLDENGQGSTTAEDVDNGSNDACGVQSTVLSGQSFSCADVGDNTVTLTVTDNNGNQSTCTATVNVADQIAPVALCNDITVLLNDDGQGEITAQEVDNGSSDACGIFTLTLNQTKFDCGNVGTVVVTLIATDVNTNQGTCPATVTIIDPVAPEALCQNVTVQLGENGEGSTTAEAVDNGSEDACGIQSLELSQTGFNCNNAGANTVTLTVTDVNGNASACSATVTVEDNIAPTALCQNVTVQLDENGEASTTAEAIDNGSTDACGLAGVSLNQTSFDCSDAGVATVTLTVTDINDNTATCTATVTVGDDIDPEVECNDITVTLNGEGSIILDGSTMAEGTDNCTIDGYATNPPLLDCSTLGETIPVTVTVNDPSGNTASCTSLVTVEGLPCGWMEMPDGIGCTNGNEADYDIPSETFTLMASGCYTPSATSDESGFIKFPLCGDGSITAHIAGLTLPGFAGIVMRESDDPGAKKVAMAYQGVNAIARYIRYTTNGPAYPSYINTPGSRWLRIERTGNIFKGYHSYNGINWTYAFTVSVPMNECIQIGLIAWGASSGSAVTATFDHVTITPPYSGGMNQRSAFDPEFSASLEPASSPAVELWPNPAANLATLSLSEEWGRTESAEVSVTVMDEFGKVVVTHRVDARVDNTVSLDMSRQAPGVYFIRVQDSEGHSTALRLLVVRP